MKRLVMVLAAALIAVGISLLSGCDGDSDPNPVPTGSVQVMLADAPASRIRELHVALEEVTLARKSHATVTVLGPEDLPDDVDVIAAGRNPVILGTVDVPVGRYTYARLGIDADSEINRVVTDDGQVHPVRLEEEAQEGVELISSFTVEADRPMTLLLDFAAAASVRETYDGWVLSPQIFGRYVERGVQFGSISGVVREADGEPLAASVGQRLGVFVRVRGSRQTLAIAEVGCRSGEFLIPQLIPGEYLVSVQPATLDWKPVGEPLIDPTPVTVRAGEEDTPEFTIDL